MPKARTRIKDVQNAADRYGIKHFRYPIDVVNYENALEDKPVMQFGPEHRMTCRHCNTFQQSDHIKEHHENRSRQGTLFEDSDG